MASRDYYRNLSLRLSRVMDYIGVSGEVVMSRRRTFLIKENLRTLCDHLLQNKRTHYFFGSQTEGTTTKGLKSDIDFLVVMENFNLILDLNDYVPGMDNLLMIQDGKFPGYCKLQLLKSDGPFPENVLPNNGYTLDEDGRVVLLHQFDGVGLERHGPAIRLNGVEGGPNDFVHAISCKTWPKGYKMWSRHPRKGAWPTSEMISYMENSGCFVVQVAHRLDKKKFESWRISTSLAERCLMFSLNVTQIRCYTLIKMIVKTFIDPVLPDIISSYICKNLLFHCIENTRSDFWQESNLLRCVNQVLQNMFLAVLCMHCPNYFNESINLLLGKVNKDNQVVLMGVIWKMLVSEGDFLGKIRYDNINELMHNYDQPVYQGKDSIHDEKCRDNHSHPNGLLIYVSLSHTIRLLMREGRFSQQDLKNLSNIMLLFALKGPLQYVSATLLFPFLCSHLATLKANEHILLGEMLSRRTSLLYVRSFDSDATSSGLKFASYLYCTGQFERAMSILAVVICISSDGFIGLCECDRKSTSQFKYFKTDRSLSMQCIPPSRLSMCVMFSKAERRCCPRELQYEMYRSTEQEKLQRDKMGYDDWMDLACTDSGTFHFFLWYITNRRLERRKSLLGAIRMIEKCIIQHEWHMDTVYNLLGQCYEYENRVDDAFACYCKSLRVKPTNNAARWHIALLLYTVYKNE